MTKPATNPEIYTPVQLANIVSQAVSGTMNADKGRVNNDGLTNFLWCHAKREGTRAEYNQPSRLAEKHLKSFDALTTQMQIDDCTPEQVARLLRHIEKTAPLIAQATGITVAELTAAPSQSNPNRVYDNFAALKMAHGLLSEHLVKLGGDPAQLKKSQSSSSMVSGAISVLCVAVAAGCFFGSKNVAGFFATAAALSTGVYSLASMRRERIDTSWVSRVEEVNRSTSTRSAILP